MHNTTLTTSGRWSRVLGAAAVCMLATTALALTAGKSAAQTPPASESLTCTASGNLLAYVLPLPPLLYGNCVTDWLDCPASAAQGCTFEVRTDVTGIGLVGARSRAHPYAAMATCGPNLSACTATLSITVAAGDSANQMCEPTGVGLSWRMVCTGVMTTNA